MPWSPPTHKPKSVWRKFADKEYDAKRLSSAKRGYGSAWRVVRKHFLVNNPLCHDCMLEDRYTPSSECHHIIKLADRPDLRDIDSNLMALCRRHHSIRTAKGE